MKEKIGGIKQENFLRGVLPIDLSQGLNLTISGASLRRLSPLVARYPMMEQMTTNNLDQCEIFLFASKNPPLFIEWVAKHYLAILSVAQVTPSVSDSAVLAELDSNE